MNSPRARAIHVHQSHGKTFRRALKDRSTVAFTRVEVLILAATVALLALLSLPLGARQQTVSTRSEQLVCMANLRHIGRAYQLWASDHDDQNPYLLDPSQGGIRGVLAANNVWYQFAWLSNELATPKVLVCPSDTNTIRIARDFSFSADGGFLNPSYRNNAASYFLSLHAFRDNPHAILAGDRNLQASSTGGACSSSGLSSVSSLPWDVSRTGAGGSFAPVWSADGQHVAFISYAKDLTTNDNFAEFYDVFVRDLASNRTTLVSVNLSGVGGGNDHSISPAVSS